ncbi:uncharacterized protein LOC129912493 [Episyrphus balteatus]|uniref:uncharacterized protein LOC129912493 n=1 Tax=Episyrphus balteatus TaxID=286459 RepID=UPI00248637E2|nr:uncharacterized protein LOC129912493 [Episyrphus balteatus]
MKVFTSTVVLFAILAGCYGYSYIVPASLSNPGICFWNGKVLPQGNSQVPGVCQNTKCNVDGSIQIDGCGPITLPNCTLIVDPTSVVSYPDCCDMTYQCIDADGNIYTKVWNQLYPNGKPDVQKIKTINLKQAIQQAKLAQAETQKEGKVVSPFILQLLLV